MAIKKLEGTNHQVSVKFHENWLKRGGGGGGGGQFGPETYYLCVEWGGIVWGVEGVNDCPCLEEGW
jgi:hypothetical protein